ncbi:MAG: NADH-quinone oxidoreductase subunit C [Methanoregula sp.]
MTDPLTQDVVAGTMSAFGTVEQVRKNRFRITTTPNRIRDAVKTVQGALSCDRLVTISTADTRQEFELHYHFTGQHRTLVTVTIALPRDAPELPTMSDLLLPAGIYERQIHDLFGIVFIGHPDLARILLNEDWPENEHPLRKDWKPDGKTFYGGTRPEGR